MPSVVLLPFLSPEFPALPSTWMFTVGSQPHLQGFSWTGLRSLPGQLPLLRCPRPDLIQSTCTSLPAGHCHGWRSRGLPGPAFPLPLKSSPTYPLGLLPSGFSCPLCPLQSRVCISSLPRGPTERWLRYSIPGASFKHLSKSPLILFLDPFISLSWVRGPRVKNRRIVNLGLETLLCKSWGSPPNSFLPVTVTASWCLGGCLNFYLQMWKPRHREVMWFTQCSGAQGEAEPRFSLFTSMPLP